MAGVVWSLLTIISLYLCFMSTAAIEPKSAVSPVFDCDLDNDMYICTGAQYLMYCNTTMHRFYYQRCSNQNQTQYKYLCMSNDCICVGNKDTCACYSNTSSCFCETFNTTVPAAVRPVLDCELNNDTYICIGAQYHMYCNTSVHYFSYYKNQNQNQYQYRCWSDDCDCRFNKDSCWCYSLTSSSCFCTNYGYNITTPSSLSPVTGLDCLLFNDTFIRTGAQYHMYCNTRINNLYYQRNRNQNQDYFECWNNNGYCRRNRGTYKCHSSTLSSCFCETYGNIIALTTAVSPVTEPDCVLYNDMYICTGAQYRMYCNTTMNYFYYKIYQYKYQYQCENNNCNCIGNKDTCTCYSSILSSCFCETYGNSIALTKAVSPVYDCGLYNDMYICTGAQYSMYCNTTVHDFYYNRNEYCCASNNCDCCGNKDTCTCNNNTSSSCYCTNYNIPAAVSPVHDCGLYNDTYICTGAQYRMYCNTRMHSFNYQRYINQNQNQYQCSNNNCYCIGNKDTCTCYSSTLSSCFCETYGNSIALTTAVSPVYDCGLYNDMYICTGAQYSMYCNTTVHDFYYNINEHRCTSNVCDCRGNKNTCTCYYSTSSSCYCTNYTIPAAGSPIYDCGLHNDTYICTGAQYRMYCNTKMHYFYYRRYSNQNQKQYQCRNNNCNCIGNKDTCTCYRSTLSSCFCEYNISIPTTLSPTTAVPSITLPDQCKSQDSEGCLKNVLEQIENITDQVLPETTVTSLLTMTFNASEKISESSSSNPAELASLGNRVLKTSEKLISALVKPTDTSESVNFTLASVDPAHIWHPWKDDLAHMQRGMMAQAGHSNDTCQPRVKKLTRTGPYLSHNICVY